jgi:hypothetical protein
MRSARLPMTRSNRSIVRIRQHGQTLIIAMIVMGVLLILGLVFLGLINRNILNAARSQRRSESADLAEAGIRYAHGQLVSSPLGADWRGTPVALPSAPAAPDLTLDPDAYYLRQSSGLAGDLGGPDKLGPFVRVPFSGGRSLVRVRYGATDANPTPAVPGGPLRNPGAARSNLIIESVGRPGEIKPNDPTTLNSSGAFRFRNYADNNDLNNNLSAMALANGQIATSRRLVAFAQIGIIDAARFETNVFNSSSPIELGVADGLGIVAFNDVTGTGSVDVGTGLSLQLGTGSTSATPLRTNPAGQGSLFVNGNLKVYGNIDVTLNRTLGDSIRVAGRITGADNAHIAIRGWTWNRTTGIYDADGTDLYNPGVGPFTFDSQSVNFSTAGGLLFDGSPRTDTVGFASGVGRLIPPSILTVDPQSKLNRYVALTRESGVEFGGNNIGRFGHGQGVFVDNAADRQEAADAEGRRTAGSQRSLFDDWLNPNSGAADSGWKGPFYVPRGAVVEFLPDGFTIQRDGSAPQNERTWKNYDGSDSGLTTVRYRLASIGVNKQLWIVDSLSNAGDINGTSLDFTKGVPFNGVLYFEGNVRVRGTIPSDTQLTLVSGATIYIDGSITKGMTNTEVTGGIRDRPIDHLPTASLMLMAKDNVAVNTSMFFGPEASQTLEAVNDVSGATGISPLRLRAAGGSESGRLSFMHEFVMDPNNWTAPYGPLAGPQNWRPYAMNYRQWNATSTGVPTQVVLVHTMDDGTAAASFLAMDVNFGIGASAYPFNAVDPDGLITNTAAAYTGQGAGQMALYGLGGEIWQRYSRFEFRSFDLIADPTTATFAPDFQRIDQPSGPAYKMYGGGNNLLLRPGSIASVSANDTLIGRAAIAPNDVKIEASIFAEQGSFFVIPGNWFNPNPNDLHTTYAQRVAELQASPNNLTLDQARAQANRIRLESFGAAPSVPFYGEPLDVRVNIVGSVAENLPPPISVQSEWIRKWGWIPRRIGATQVGIPWQHVPASTPNDASNYLASRNFVPNLVIQYDPVLATGRLNTPNLNLAVPIRKDEIGRPLPPMPRLPVSPRLAYFGEL